MPRAKIQVAMDDEDFSRLFHTAGEWAANMDGTPQAPDSGFRGQISDGRFRPQPAIHWKWSYWTDSYASVILCRAFLSAWGFPCEVVSDEAGGEWAILTDYDWRQPGGAEGSETP